MKQEKNKYVTLFLATLQLSAFTFGGGFVIVPLMRKKFVEQLHWIGEEEMLDFAAIAQSSPGAIAVNASILVGYRVAGVPGALLTVCGTVLPPLVILSVISLFYEAFRQAAIVDMAMTGMLAGVAAVICDVVLTMGRDVIASRRALPVAVLLLSFVAVHFFGLNIIALIAVCALIGAADTIHLERRKRSVS